ncbi:hypothetical protein [Litoreibacter janthinus]|uniref:Uncharacterized protein n=1 Tax=Litoreibacter janthinus TaxID=670154 RepID=A0A1I6HQ69_9RHOB|nr:hypothetical protein [Litoreibacter janthinus]SFR56589.1 hypothetical protein SAMN04488002_3256 [Litoreibacter janthinus]
MGNQRFTMMKWKAEWGLQFYLLQNPLSAPYVTSSEPEKIGEVNVETGAEIQGVKRYKKGRKGVRYKSTSIKPRLGIMRNSGREGMAEIALRASSFAYNMSMHHALYREIKQINDQIARGVKQYGGVLIVGRVHMMQYPNPDTGVRMAYMKDCYCADAGKSVDEVFKEETVERAAIGPQQGKGGAPRAYMSAAKFPMPPYISPPPYGQVEERFLMWAEKALLKKRELKDIPAVMNTR